MNPLKTVLVVDDEAKITEVLEAYLQKAGYRTVSAGNGPEALRLFSEESPALIVLDLMLPGLAGEDVCRAIRRSSNVPIIMLTAKADEDSILKGLDIGADDYVTKPFSPRQIVARVNAVLRRTRGEKVSAQKEYSFNNGELSIDDNGHEVKKCGRQVYMTPNEYKILFAMARYPSKTFTREELIAVALGDEFEGFDRVIDTHIKNIRQKIEDHSKSPRYVITVHGIGYKFGGEPDKAGGDAR